MILKRIGSNSNNKKLDNIYLDKYTTVSNFVPLSLPF